MIWKERVFLKVTVDFFFSTTIIWYSSILLLFRLKGFEMICESYPQFILNLFIMQSLQIQEWYNICSCAISAISVVYGFSELMCLISHDTSDYPFSRTVNGMLAIIVDSFFRALSLAYFMTFLKGYILIFPLIYYLILLTKNTAD